MVYGKMHSVVTPYITLQKTDGRRRLEPVSDGNVEFAFILTFNVCFFRRKGFGYGIGHQFKPFVFIKSIIDCRTSIGTVQRFKVRGYLHNCISYAKWGVVNVPLFELNTRKNYTSCINYSMSQGVMHHIALIVLNKGVI